MSDESDEHADPEVEGQGRPSPLTDEEQRELEEERAQRLDPGNRPERAEVDNTDAELPTVREFEEQSGDDVEGAAGTSDPAEKFREVEIGEEEQERIAEDREQRLDPDNRPDNTEVDNTQRTFEGDRFVD